MIYKITLLILSLMSLTESTPCEIADVQTVIGGDGFRIQKISSATNVLGDILVGGIIEKYRVEAGNTLNTFLTSFLYLL